MLGFRKKTPQQDTQIPYEVYETIQQPAARRRAWIVRLVAALLVVTILIVGGVVLKRTFLDDDKSASTDSSQTQKGNAGQQGGQLQPPKTLIQSPQQNPSLPKTGSAAAEPVTVPQSEATNTATVRKPE